LLSFWKDESGRYSGQSLCPVPLYRPYYMHLYYTSTVHNKRRNFGAKFKILKLSNRLSVLMPSVLLYIPYMSIYKITRWLLRYAPRFQEKIWQKKIDKKKFKKKNFFKFFLAIGIWGMPAKIFGGLGPLV
jgi:hypothetical protein